MNTPARPDLLSPTDRVDAARLARTALPAVVAAGFAALPLLEQSATLAIIAVTGVAVSGAVATWYAWRREQLAADALSAAGETAGVAGSGGELFAAVLPIWRDNLVEVRDQTESAIQRLIDSFAAITGQFEAAGFTGVHGAASAQHGGADDLLARCERQLQPVVASMSSILDSKGSLLSGVEDLSRATHELQEMAQGVAKIATQTNMLAINAAIEAAHAGDTGRGFAVIAREIRALSEVSGRTARQITARMEEVNGLMNAATQAASDASANDRQVVEASGRVVEDVLVHVRALGARSEAMLGQGNAIRAEVESLMVSLQFQDRVRQIIGVVEDDIDRLARAIAGRTPLPDVGAWLNELHDRYTTDEQRRGHLSNVGHGPGVVAAAPAASVEFF